jgi:hypothetical protein
LAVVVVDNQAAAAAVVAVDIRRIGCEQVLVAWLVQVALVVYLVYLAEVLGEIRPSVALLLAAAGVQQSLEVLALAAAGVRTEVLISPLGETRLTVLQVGRLAATAQLFMDMQVLAPLVEWREAES